MCEGAIALPLVVTSRHGVLLHVQYLALSTLRTIGCCFRTGLLTLLFFSAQRSGLARKVLWSTTTEKQRASKEAVPRPLRQKRLVFSVDFLWLWGRAPTGQWQVSVKGRLESFDRGDNSKLTIISHLLSGGKKTSPDWSTPVNDRLIVASLRSREFKKYCCNKTVSSK